MNPTRAAKKREKGGVVKADVEGKLALGSVHQGGVGQAHLRFYIVRGEKSSKFQEGRSDIENAFSGPPQQPGCPWPCSRNHCEGVDPRPRLLGPLLDLKEARTWQNNNI